MRHILLHFENEDFNKIENMKEEAKINGECDSWEDYLLKVCKVRK